MPIQPVRRAGSSGVGTREAAGQRAVGELVRQRDVVRADRVDAEFENRIVTRRARRDSPESSAFPCCSDARPAARRTGASSNANGSAWPIQPVSAGREAFAQPGPHVDEAAAGAAAQPLVASADDDVDAEGASRRTARCRSSDTRRARTARPSRGSAPTIAGTSMSAPETYAACERTTAAVRSPIALHSASVDIVRPSSDGTSARARRSAPTPSRRRRRSETATLR